MAKFVFGVVVGAMMASGVWGLQVFSGHPGFGVMLFGGAAVVVFISCIHWE